MSLRPLVPTQVYEASLADLPAVRLRRVYKVPAGGYPWDPPSQESPLYWEWLAMQLHPALPGWPLREHIRQAYQQLYGLTVDAAFSRVAKELGRAYPELGEEFALSSIELGFLTERRQAFENLAYRVNLVHHGK